MKTKSIVASLAAAVLGFALVASAASYTFSNYLSVGSTGADVSALQNFLMANGYNIAALASGAAQPGYFGSQTQAAVKAYQAAKGIPSTGFVGPLTVASLNNKEASGQGGGNVSMACPIGFTCTPIVNTTCPANTTCTPIGGTVAGQTGITTVGVPGTLNVSLWSSPSNGTVVYKGQSYDVFAIKAQAAASDMAVQSVSLDFSDRLWLYASGITLHDDQGNTIGQVSNLNFSSFSELTVGQDYRITIPVSNYVVKSTQTRYITANVTFLATSDRLTRTLGVTNYQIRAVDGTGVTDTESVNSNTTTSASDSSNGVALYRSFVYQGSGGGSIVVTVDPSSPLAGLVQVSTGGQTVGVPLAVYDIKSSNAPGTLQSISFNVYTAGSSKLPADLFAQYSLKVNGNTYGAQNIVASTTNTHAATVTFSNFGNITLPADTYVPVTLNANVQQDTNNALDGTIASTSLVVNATNLQVVDQSFNQLSFGTTGGFVSSNLIFSGSSATLSNYVAGVDSAITYASSSAYSNPTVGYNVHFGFTVTAGNNTLYLAADPATSLLTSTTGANVVGSLTYAGVTANPSQISGDSGNPPAQAGYYVVPAGSSRSFSFIGSLQNVNGTPSSPASLKSFSITGVNYGTSTTALSAGLINYNLGSLKVTSTF